MVLPDIDTLLFLAGLAQVALVAGSTFIPKVLNWRAGLQGLQPLLRQMFWVYAAYILVINLCFGLLSIFSSYQLLNGSSFAGCITGFIAIYWISRVLIQFFYFDRSGIPAGLINRILEFILICLFAALSIIYSVAFYINLKPILR